MAKKSRKYDVTIRMGSTNYEIVVGSVDPIVCDLSLMTKHERRELRKSLVLTYRDELAKRDAKTLSRRQRQSLRYNYGDEKKAA